MILKWFLIAATILNVVAYVVPTRADSLPPDCITIEKSREINETIIHDRILSVDEDKLLRDSMKPNGFDVAEGTTLMAQVEDDSDPTMWHFQVFSKTGNKCMVGHGDLTTDRYKRIFGEPT